MLPQHCPRQPPSISNHPPIRNLNIQKYTFADLLGIFHLTPDMSLADLKRAKQKVLATHPDKSHLPPDYFIFYKKAFETVVEYYNTRNQIETSGTRMEEMKTAGAKHAYNPNYNPMNDHEAEQMRSAIRRMETGKQSQSGGGQKFNQQFNQLFEENMTTGRPDPAKNAWFSGETTALKTDGIKVSQGNMGEVFNRLKDQQQNMRMVQYTGVRNMVYGTGAVGNLYEDEEEDRNSYKTSDPFSKLKFDDLRKVHNDETILNVSERQYDTMPKYRNVDEYNRARPNEYGYANPDAIESEEQMRANRISQLHQAEIMRSMENAKRQEELKARFLRLK